MFIVSYVPLAGMFAALHWPTGWQTVTVVEVFGMALATAVVALLGPSAIAIVGRRAQIVVVTVSALATAALVFGGLNGWFRPMAITVPHGHTTALISAVGVGFAAAGLLIVVLLLYNAGRAGAVHWTVSDPKDQGATVAGYLATYLLPLLGVAIGGWRAVVAYAIYFGVLYVVYVSTDSLVLINPTLYLFRYRIYDVQTMVTTESPHLERVLLVTKRRIAGQEEVDVLPLGDESYLAR